MKELSPAQMLEAFDRALAEAARMAARRRTESAGQKTALAEDAAKFDATRR